MFGLITKANTDYLMCVPKIFIKYEKSIFYPKIDFLSKKVRVNRNPMTSSSVTFFPSKSDHAIINNIIKSFLQKTKDKIVHCHYWPPSVVAVAVALAATVVPWSTLNRYNWCIHKWNKKLYLRWLFKPLRGLIQMFISFY